VTLHDELRELVDTFGEGLLGDADQFRAALDDYLPENAALPGQLNVLYDAVRFGAYARCVELLSRGSDPILAVGTAGDLLARERGTTEVITSRWAVASLAHATGHLATDALSVFLQPDTAGGPVQAPAPSVPAPSGPPPGSLPSGPPPPYPPPTYVPPVETAPGTPPSWPTSEQPPESAQNSTPAPPPTTSEPVPADPAAASSTPVPPQTVTAPLGPISAPPGSSPDEARRGSRRTGLIAAAAAAAVVVAGVGTYVAVADDDEEPPGQTARDSSTADPPSTPPTSGGTTPPTPLAAPGAPRLDASGAYLSVSFTISGPLTVANGVELEMRSAEGWTDAPSVFELPTDQGGEQACAVVRAVRVEGDQRRAGASVRECGTSQPRTVEWARSSTGCPPAGGVSCYTYDLSVAGFRPDEDITMEIVGGTDPRSGVFYSCQEKCTKPVSIDADGRGHLRDALRAYAGSSNVLVVGGVRSRLQAVD
jgi:hypothetical protein